MKHYSAIIGYNYMGPMHCDIIRREVAELEVIGVYDIRQECQDRARAEGLHAYASLEELLDDPKVELVTIATPNDAHKELAIRCLRAGKNVVCEKPVTIHSGELEEIMTVARETGRIFTIHHNRRWDVSYRQIKKVIEDGTIGKPYYVESRVGGYGRGMYGWRGYKQNGGGMLLDWGVHLLDQLLDLFDSPIVSVDAHVISLYTPEADDNAKIFLRYENGITAVCEVSNNNFVKFPRWHVSCEHGTAVVYDNDTDGVIRQADTTDEVRTFESIVYTENGPVAHQTVLPMDTFVELPLPEADARWSYFYKNVIAAIEGREELIVRPEQAMRVLKVIELALQSSVENRPIVCRI